MDMRCPSLSFFRCPYVFQFQPFFSVSLPHLPQECSDIPVQCLPIWSLLFPIAECEVVILTGKICIHQSGELLLGHPPVHLPLCFWSPVLFLFPASPFLVKSI